MDADVFGIAPALPNAKDIVLLVEQVCGVVRTTFLVTGLLFIVNRILQAKFQIFIFTSRHIAIH